MVVVQNSSAEKILEDIMSFISETSGIRFRETHKLGVLRFIKDRIEKLNVSYGEYEKLLRSDEQEVNSLINASTVNETYFFREENQFKLVEKLVKGREKASFWSAACSSGEEVYSLKLICDSLNVDADYFASDINTEKLKILKQGVYNEKQAAREIDGKDFHDLLAPYLSGEIIRFPEEMVKSIESERINLTDLDSYSVLNGRKFDFIFLRNLFIYFSLDVRYKVLNYIAQNHLSENGYIFVSMSEIAQLEEKYLVPDLEKICIDNIFLFHNKKTQEIEESHG